MAFKWVAIAPKRRGEKRYRLDGGTSWELAETAGYHTIIENPERIGWGRNVRWIERTREDAEEKLAAHLKIVAELK